VFKKDKLTHCVYINKKKLKLKNKCVVERV